MVINAAGSSRWEEGSVRDATQAIGVLECALQSKDPEVMESALLALDVDWCTNDRLTGLYQEVQLSVNRLMRKPR